MRNSWRLIGRITLPIAALFASGASGQASPFSVTDSLRVAKFNDPTEGSIELRQYDGGWSPDGSRFAFVTSRADETLARTVATIWMIDGRSIQETLNGHRVAAPATLTTLACDAFNSNAGSDNYLDGTIVKVRWTDDGRRIRYLGCGPNGARRLFEIDVNTREIAPLTPERYDVLDYAAAGETIVFRARLAEHASNDFLTKAAGRGVNPLQMGAGKSLPDLLFPNWTAMTFGTERLGLWTIKDGQLRAVQGANGPVSLPANSEISLDPSGRLLIGTDVVRHIPQSWTQYSIGFDYGGVGIAPDESPEAEVNADDIYRPTQHVLIDLETGKVSPFIDGPIGQRFGFFQPARAFWSPDGASVIVTNNYIPTSASSARARPCVALVNVKTRRTVCLLEHKTLTGAETTFPPLISVVQWARDGREIKLGYRDFSSPGLGFRAATMLTRTPQAWNERQLPSDTLSPPETVRNGMSIEVWQSLNQAPVLRVREKATGKTRTLFDPNPQLVAMKMGHAEIFEWRDSKGRMVKGGLVRPPEFDVGKRYPLIIQTHGFDEGAFLNAGPAESGFAARALASKGFLVLQVQEPQDHLHKDDEAEYYSSLYAAAMDALVAAGNVDAKRVGILGYSRTGWYVWHALVEDPDRYSTAVLAEGDVASVWTYAVNADYLGTGGRRATSYETKMGSRPFGPGLTNWIERSPGLRTDRVKAPVLFSTFSPVFLLYSWDGYALLRLQEKAVDMLYLREGKHALARPAQRLIAQKGTVNWFDFWLNGKEDDPEFTSTYRYWRKLCAIQRDREPTRATYCGRGATSG